jgi:hypothetical protein
VELLHIQPILALWIDSSLGKLYSWPVESSGSFFMVISREFWKSRGAAAATAANRDLFLNI